MRWHFGRRRRQLKHVFFFFFIFLSVIGGAADLKPMVQTIYDVSPAITEARSSACPPPSISARLCSWTGRIAPEVGAGQGGHHAQERDLDRARNFPGVR